MRIRINPGLDGIRVPSNGLRALEWVDLLRMMGHIARRFLISGSVQGVGFRYFAQRAARQNGVTGWVRNLSDGSVEVHANGTESQLQQLEAVLREGPPNAEVRYFESIEATLSKAANFSIR